MKYKRVFSSNALKSVFHFDNKENSIPVVPDDERMAEWPLDGYCKVSVRCLERLGSVHCCTTFPVDDHFVAEEMWVKMTVALLSEEVYC